VQSQSLQVRDKSLVAIVEHKSRSDLVIHARHHHGTGVQTNRAHHLHRRPLQGGAGHDRGDGHGAIARHVIVYDFEDRID